MSAPRPAAAARGADVFVVEFERLRPHLHLHCYRMLASFTDADDAMHEIAWRAAESPEVFDSDELSSALYTLATNTCLDKVRRRTTRITDIGEMTEGPWLTPYPDRLLDASVVRETVELAYVAALQLLDARHRAVLLLREVLGWTATEVASALELSTTAVNSSLTRARSVLRDHLPEHVSVDVSTSRAEIELLMAYVDCYQNGSVNDLVALMREDVVVTMPPDPMRYEGIAEVSELFVSGTAAQGEWSVQPTAANRSPAVACYLREPGNEQSRICKFDVLRIVDSRIAEVTTFGRALAGQFGFPEHL